MRNSAFVFYMIIIWLSYFIVIVLLEKGLISLFSIVNILHGFPVIVIPVDGNGSMLLSILELLNVWKIYSIMNLWLLCNTKKTDKQQEQQLAYHPNKGQQCLQILFVFKSSCIQAFILTIEKGFSFCLVKSALWGLRTTKIGYKQPKQLATN